IAVLVFACQVTSYRPIPDDIFCSRCRVVPVAQNHHRIGPSNGPLPNIAHSNRLAGLINDIHDVAGNGTPHRTGPHRHQHGTIAQDEIHLSLAVAFMRRDTEFFTRPADDLFTDRLTTRKNRPQAHVILLTWGLDVPHHLEGCWHQESITYPMPRHQIKGMSRIEFAHTVGYDGHAVVPTRKQYVVQPANPGPV